MKISMYTASVPVMIKALKNLSSHLDKGVLHATNKKIKPDALLNERLIVDQFPLVRQVQIACDTAKATVAKLAGLEAPKHEDTEATMEELKARIDKTVAYLQTIKAEDMDGSEDIKVPFRYAPEKYLTGLEQLTEFALPNFFFHIVTAYAILRHAGVELGKADFMGELSLKDLEA